MYPKGSWEFPQVVMSALLCSCLTDLQPNLCFCPCDRALLETVKDTISYLYRPGFWSPKRFALVAIHFEKGEPPLWREGDTNRLEGFNPISNRTNRPTT